MKLLSHYTSEVGLAGIAASHAMRATEFFSLNDEAEFVYGFRLIFDKALQKVTPRIPKELLDPSKGHDALAGLGPDFEAALKKHAIDGDGYGSLFVCSFARGRDADENNRGILTLWDRYTKLAGFCLQFDEASVRSIVSHEDIRWNYDLIALEEVKYGIEQSAAQLETLAEQSAQRLLKSLYERYRDNRLAPEPARFIPEPVYFRDLLVFCATHKDPAFRDEREKRILAYPARNAKAVPFTGAAHPKPIQKRPDRVRFIGLGEHLEPGFAPCRIIIGPQAKLAAGDIQALYPNTRNIDICGIPIH